MLVIRREQMEVFENEAGLGFEDRMVEHIAKDFPNRFRETGEPGAREYIRTSKEAGAGNGLVSNTAVGLFITLKLEYGENFERSPDGEAARAMLRNPSFDGDTKAIEIAKRLIAGSNGRRIVQRPAAD